MTNNAFDPSDLSKQVILIVDDEPDNLALLQTTLEYMHSAVVHTAMSCQEALDILDTIQPTLIITDISMPEIDGFGLLEKLRARPATAQLPVIALTAHAMRSDRDRIMTAGFNEYYSKPFEVTSIGVKLGHFLREFAAKPPAPVTQNVAQNVTQNVVQNAGSGAEVPAPPQAKRKSPQSEIRQRFGW